MTVICLMTVLCLFFFPVRDISVKIVHNAGSAASDKGSSLFTAVWDAGGQKIATAASHGRPQRPNCL